jgi:hypothetical protein
MTIDLGSRAFLSILQRRLYEPGYGETLDSRDPLKEPGANDSVLRAREDESVRLVIEGEVRSERQVNESNLINVIVLGCHNGLPHCHGHLRLLLRAGKPSIEERAAEVAHHDSL